MLNHKFTMARLQGADFSRSMYRGGDSLGKGDDVEQPDYAPLANASAQSAATMAALGDRQLAESRRQYDQNYAAMQPIVQTQKDVMDESLRQGKDYYDYMVANQRPVEQKLNAEAMAAGGDARIDEMVGKAISDARQGTAAAQNQMLRQGLRYGYSPNRLATMAGRMSNQQGLAEASAANTAREKEQNLAWAKKMDVAGLYRGLSGASQGAYNTALGAGNAAGQTQMAPGSAYLQGMGQSASMTGQGLGLQNQGLGGVLNAQTSAYNASQSGGSPLMGLAGMGLGAWAQNGFSTSWFS